MPPLLHIKLLGAPQVTLQGTPLRFARRKALALLAYIAVTGRPHTRETLASLLAGETSDRLARQQLRNALHDLSLRLDPYLEVTAQTVALTGSSALVVDACVFTAMVRAALAAADPEGLEQATGEYAGELLEGFALRDAPGFEEWLLLERERLRSLLLEALQQLVELRSERAELDAAIAAARRVLALEPASEQTHRQLMHLFVRNGQPHLALVQYEECQRVLAAELGIAPSAATRSFYEQLRAPAGIPPHNLPPRPAPFVGRSAELAWLRKQLANPDCRVITIVGLGGSGKTRLALEAAAHYLQPEWYDAPSPFPDGIYVVDLAGEASPATAAAMAAQQIAAAIAPAVGLVFQGAIDAPHQLTHALRARRLLLLLDNAEDLVAGATLLAQLVAQAPHLKLLVTSRVPLQIQAEWLLALPGLAIPATEQQLEATEASQLFLAQTRRFMSVLELTPEERQALVQLCGMVQGLPLALILAAGLTRTVRISEQVAELGQSLELLSSSARDLPARQQSIATVLSWAWQRLTPALRTIVQQAAVFRGGFDPEAARAVLHAGLLQLHRLCESGLVSRDTTGRYRLHELVRQYGDAQLAPAEAAQARERHALHYAGLAAGLALDERPQREVLSRVATEYANLEAAWEWAVGGGRADVLARLQPTLSTWLDLNGLFQVGLERFGAAVARFRPNGAAGVDEHIGALLVELAHFHVRLGRYDEARPHLHEALKLRATGRGGELAARARYYLGLCDYHQGALSSALQMLAEALELAERVGALRLQVELLQALSQLGRRTSDDVQAGEWLAQGLALARQLDMRRHIAVLLSDQADAAYAASDYTRAQTGYEESLALGRELDDRSVIPRALAGLGRVGRAQGQFALARGHYEAGLAMARATGNIPSQAACLNGLGVVALQQREYAAARAWLEENVQLTRLIGDKEGTAYALSALAGTYVESGDTHVHQGLMEEALSLLRIVNNHRGVARMLGNMGLAAITRSEYERARVLLEESLVLHRMLDSHGSNAFVLNNLGLVALLTGDIERARACFAESAVLRLQQGEAWTLAYSLAGLAAAVLGRPGAGVPADVAHATLESAMLAARLAGATDRLLAQVGSSLADPYRAVLAETVERATGLLGAGRYAAAYAEGYAAAPAELLASGA